MTVDWLWNCRCGDDTCRNAGAPIIPRKLESPKIWASTQLWRAHQVDEIAVRLAQWLPSPSPDKPPPIARRSETPAELDALRLALHDAEEQGGAAAQHVAAIRAQVAPDLVWKRCSFRFNAKRRRHWPRRYAFEVREILESPYADGVWWPTVPSVYRPNADGVDIEIGPDGNLVLAAQRKRGRSTG